MRKENYYDEVTLSLTFEFNYPERYQFTKQRLTESISNDELEKYCRNEFEHMSITDLYISDFEVMNIKKKETKFCSEQDCLMTTWESDLKVIFFATTNNT